MDSCSPPAPAPNPRRWPHRTCSPHHDGVAGLTTTAEHPACHFGPSRSGKYAELSRDGRFLYVAVQRGESVLDEYTNWTVTSTATGLKKIDTETWQVVSRLDTPVSQIALSPDGAHLLETGSTAAETNASYMYHP